MIVSTKNLVFLFVLFISAQASAKNLTLEGSRPYASVTKRLNELWDANVFYAETLNLSDVSFEGKHYSARDIQSYFQAGLVYRYSPNINFSGGYVFQRNNPLSQDFSNEDRLWQQFLYSQPFSNGNISHRFRLEERFIHDRVHNDTQPMATRLRYQLAYTAPFVGVTIVAGGFFYSIYNEFYLSTSGERNALFSEDWVYGGFGFQTLNYGRLEFGPLLQWAVINKAKDTRTLWLAQLGWSYNF